MFKEAQAIWKREVSHRSLWYKIRVIVTVAYHLPPRIVRAIKQEIRKDRNH